MFLLGLQAAAWRVPFLPTRVGLGSDILRDQPRRCARCVRPIRRPTDGGEELVAVPALTSTPPSCHLNRSDARGNAAVPRPRSLHRRPLPRAADRRRSCRPSASCRPRTARRRGRHQSLRISRLLVDGVIEAPNGAHFTSCDPDYPRDEAFQKQYAAAAKSRRRGPRSATEWLDLRRGRLPGEASAAEAAVTATGCSRLRDAGRRLRRRDGRVLPGRRRDPRQPDRHHPDDRRPPGPGHLRARPRYDRR